MVKDSNLQAALARAEAALGAEDWTQACGLAAELLTGPADDALKARAQLVSARALWHLDQQELVFQHAREAALLASRLGDAGLHVSANTLACFALTELGCAQAALPLALQALEETAGAADALYRLRPVALSCAAHVHACLGDAHASEALHMEALSLARENGAPEGLQMAYGNLTLSLSLAHREARMRGDAALMAAATAYAQKHIPQLRRLARDERLEPWRRISLRQDLAELLAFCGSMEEAEALYRESMNDPGGPLHSGYYALSTKADLAEMLAAKGRHQEVFDLLHPAVAAAQGVHGGYRRWLLALNVLLNCCHALGLEQQAAELAARIAATEADLSAVRERVLARLASAQP